MAYYKIGVLYQKQAREDDKQQGDKKTQDLSDKLKVIFCYQVL